MRLLHIFFTNNKTISVIWGFSILMVIGAFITELFGIPVMDIGLDKNNVHNAMHFMDKIFIGMSTGCFIYFITSYYPQYLKARKERKDSTRICFHNLLRILSFFDKKPDDIKYSLYDMDGIDMDSQFVTKYSDLYEKLGYLRIDKEYFLKSVMKQLPETYDILVNKIPEYNDFIGEDEKAVLNTKPLNAFIQDLIVVKEFITKIPDNKNWDEFLPDFETKIIQETKNTFMKDFNRNISFKEDLKYLVELTERVGRLLGCE